MTEPTEMQLLIGQLAADALIRDALLIALMEIIPDLHSRLESKVAATAHVAENRLPVPCRDQFRERLADVRKLLSDAYP